MKKHVIRLCIIFIAMLSLCIYFSKYTFYLNEPIYQDTVSNENISYLQTNYKDNSNYGVYTIKMNNSIFTKFYYAIFRDSCIKTFNLINDNQYIVKFNNKTKSIEERYYWNFDKYGKIDSYILDKQGKIYVLSHKQSLDESQIYEQNILCYDKNDENPSLIYNIKYDDFVNEVNKHIKSIDLISNKITWAEYDGKTLSIKQFDNQNTLTVYKTAVASSYTKKLNYVAIMDKYCYVSFTNNRLYKFNYEDNKINLIKNFHEDKCSLYKMYKYNENNIYLHLHQSSDEKLKTFDGKEFKDINLNDMSVSQFLDKNYRTNLNTFKLNTDIKKYIALVSYLVIFLLLLFFLRYFYVHILDKKIYITFKIVICILPIILIGKHYIATYTALYNYELVEKELFNGKLQTFSDYFQSKFDRVEDEYKNKAKLGDLFGKIKLYQDIDEDTMKEIHKILDYDFVGMDIDTTGWYWSFDIIDNNKMYKVYDTELNDSVYFSRRATGQNVVTDPVLKGKIYTTTEYNGQYMFYMYPVRDSKGKLVGMTQVGTYYEGFKNELFNKFYEQNSRKISFLTNLMLLVIILITIKSLYPLIRFTKQIKNLSDNRIKEVKEARTNDEVQILTHSFNQMAKNINENMSNIMQINDSYYRFVPLELINLLGKKNIKDVNLGDNIEREFAILCVGVDDFYEVVFDKKAEEIFTVMSQIYEYIAPFIRDNGGIIDRFTDKGLIAIFPNTSVYGALKASREIVAKTQELNINESRFEGIDLSCTIDYGNVTVGILGDEKRLQNSAISYVTNNAMVIQENSVKLSSKIVLTSGAYNLIDNNDKKSCRHLGKIMFTSLNSTIDLYDYYGADNSELKNIKDINREDFEKAVNDFESGQYKDSRLGFIKILDKNIKEEIARIYFYQTDLKINNVDNDEENALKI